VYFFYSESLGWKVNALQYKHPEDVNSTQPDHLNDRTCHH